MNLSQLIQEAIAFQKEPTQIAMAFWRATIQKVKKAK